MSAVSPRRHRSYETNLRLHVLPILGATKLVNVRLGDVQDLAERVALERNPSTVRNVINPLRAIFKRARLQGLIEINPTEGLALPAVDGQRDRIATPEEAAVLIDALPSEDRPIWATAMYAGLRLGELQALKREDINLDDGVIAVHRSWDRRKGLVDPKSRAGTRRVPIPQVLREPLADLLARHAATGSFAFGRADGRPFAGETIRRRARRAWEAEGLNEIGLHEARHTYASICIAAGVNAKTLTTYMGHSSITTTFDRYGHLFPGSENEAIALLDRYLDPAAGGSPTPIATP